MCARLVTQASLAEEIKLLFCCFVKDASCCEMAAKGNVAQLALRITKQNVFSELQRRKNNLSRFVCVSKLKSVSSQKMKL